MSTKSEQLEGAADMDGLKDIARLLLLNSNSWGFITAGNLIPVLQSEGFGIHVLQNHDQERLALCLLMVVGGT